MKALVELFDFAVKAMAAYSGTPQGMAEWNDVLVALGYHDAEPAKEAPPAEEVIGFFAKKTENRSIYD